MDDGCFVVCEILGGFVFVVGSVNCLDMLIDIFGLFWLIWLGIEVILLVEIEIL